MGTSYNVALWSKTPASNATADAGINWTEGQLPSTVNDSARAMMAALANKRDDENATVLTTGTANAYAVTTNQGFTALASGLVVAIKCHAANTSSATVNVDTLGAKAIRKFTTAGEVALSGGELQTNGRYLLQYDTALNGGAGAWIVLNPSTAATSGTVTSVATSGYVTGGPITSTGTISLGSMGAASRLLGSNASAAGITDISLGNGLSLSGATLSAKGVAQVVSSLAVGSAGTTTTQMGTISATGGAQFSTVTITPVNGSSTLIIRVCATLVMSAIGTANTALVQGTTLLCGGSTTVSTAGGTAVQAYEYILTSPGTSAITFNLRAGPNVAATLTYGPASTVAGITVTEVLP